MRLTFLTASILSSGLVSAATLIPGEYISLFGGLSYLPDNINQLVSGFWVNDIAYKKGYNFGARFGFSNSSIRYEAEYTYLQTSPKSFYVNNLLQTQFNGKSIANLLMANLYYDTPEILPAFNASIGLGIGYANLRTVVKNIGLLGLTDFALYGNGFAYQGTAGLSYQFHNNFALNLAYRYVATNESSIYGRIFQAHLTDLGFIYHFDCTNLYKDME